MQPYPDARELVWASRKEQRHERPAMKDIKSSFPQMSKAALFINGLHQDERPYTWRLLFLCLILVRLGGLLFSDF